MKTVRGEITLPGDKSISHRSALFSSFMPFKSRFTNFNFNEDCTATLNCLENMGINWNYDGKELLISGRPITQWVEPSKHLDAKNSGTTSRLISGILSNLHFPTTLTGDSSLSKRPMGRIIDPLRLMGANISAVDNHLPMKFSPSGNMRGIHYRLPVASAQVKSAVLLSGIFAEGETEVIENVQTRDHTERMLNLRKRKNEDGSNSIFSSSDINFRDISMKIPGDFSSAAFFIVAALISQNSDLFITNASLNPTRTGLLNVLREMGGSIEAEITNEYPEPVGRIHVKSQQLKNIEIQKEIIPNIIDEIPILSILATQSDGEFVIHSAEELRYKESDRIKTIVENLAALGIKVTEFTDGFSIQGPQKIKGGKVTTFNDHRIAMAFTIAGLSASGTIEIDNPKCASVSFPDFYDILRKITN
jgi:3-phosphoshikimate 1-carboxyvinyltransferase